MANELTAAEKIALLNTLHKKVIDWSCSCGECEYIIVPLDDETRNVLYKLGKDDKWINDNNYCENNTEFDLAVVGFEFAEWWSPANGFS